MKIQAVSPLPILLVLSAWVIAFSACASVPALPAIAPDMGIPDSTDQALPPSYWPEDCGVEFLDQEGSVLVFGLPATLRSARVLEDGSVVAAALDLGKGLFSLNGVRFRAEPGKTAGSGRVLLEWRGARGFLLSVSNWSLSEGRLLAEGSLGLSPTASGGPGMVSFVEGAVLRVPLARTGPLWQEAALGPLSLGYRSSATMDFFRADEASLIIGSGSTRLSSALRLPEQEGLAFNGVGIGPEGDISFDGPGTGTLMAKLDDGSLLSLSALLPGAEGLWAAEGELILPESDGGGKLFFREGSLSLSALSGPSGSGICAAPTLSLKRADWELALAEPTVEFTEAGISLSSSSSTLDYGGFDLPVGPLSRPLSGAVSTEGARFSSMMLPLAAGLFRASSASFDGKRLYLSGSLSFPPGFPASELPVDGLAADLGMEALRMANLEPLSFRAFGSSWTATGLSLTASSIVLKGTDASLPAGRRLKMDAFSLDLNDPEAAVGSADEGKIEDFAVGSDLAMRDASWDRNGGFRASGSAMIEFVVSSQVFRRELSLKAFSLDAYGKIDILEQEWPESPVHAFLGLVFLDADLDFREGRPYILLSGGSFEKGGIFPSGGTIDNLGMDIAARAYDRGKLAFAEPATFLWRNALFSLEGFDSVLDDEYSFSGSVILPAAPGAPWKEGERLPLSSLRLNGYGQVISAVVLRRGRSLDLRDILPEGLR